MSHAWLPNAPVFVNAPTREMKVRELIDEDTRQWDRGIHALFDRRACEDILAVPLNQLNSPEKLIWKENRTHSFSVRTAYQVALRLKNPHQAEHSSVQVHMEENLEAKCTTKSAYFNLEGMFQLLTDAREPSPEMD